MSSKIKMENKEDESPVSVAPFCPIDKVGRGDDLEVVKEKEKKEEKGDLETSNNVISSVEETVPADDSISMNVVGLTDQTTAIEHWPGQNGANAYLPGYKNDVKCLLEQKSENACLLKEKNATVDEMAEQERATTEHLHEQKLEQVSATAVEQKYATEQLVEHKGGTALLCEQKAANKPMPKHSITNPSDESLEQKSATEALPGQNAVFVGGTNVGEHALIQQDQNDNQYHPNYGQQPMMGHSGYGPQPGAYGGGGGYGPPPQRYGGGMFGNTSGTMVCVIVYAIYFCLIVVPVSIFIAVSVYGYNEVNDAADNAEKESETFFDEEF